MSKLKALSPVRLKQVIAVLTTLGALIALSSRFESLGRLLVPNGVLLTWPFLVACSVVPLTICFLIYNYCWYKEQESHEATQSQKEVLEARLKAYEAELMSDPVTGIPNNHKFKRDISRLKRRYAEELKSNVRTARQETFQIVQLDLNDFKKLNQTAGELKADRILRIIAQNIYQTMRRNEEMYQLEPGETTAPLPRDEGYRKYPGGDEFVFLLRGGNHVAVGFTARLKLKLEEKAEEIRKIAGYDYSLGFCAAIARYSAEQDYEGVRTIIEKCLKRASLSAERYSICWHAAESEEHSDDPKIRDSYTFARSQMEVMTVDETP